MSIIDSITITFGDQAENHVGMQKIGALADKGFTYDEMLCAKAKFEAVGCICEMHDLRDLISDETIKSSLDPAYILIIHNAVDNLLNEIGKTAEDLYKEQRILEVDKKAKMYGRVVNKSARYNLCFSSVNQEPDYENGKGRIISFDNVPLTKYVRDKLPEFIGSTAKDLEGEGNYYYNSAKCGIGYHGDAERKKVVAIRLGKAIDLSFLWFYKNNFISNPNKGAAILRINNMKNGSMYIMSEKATGHDWKKKNIYTLRHSAGASKYTQLPVSYTIGS